MADYQFKIDNKDFKIKMGYLQSRFPNFMKTILGRLGMRLLAKVKVLTPVDTGLLRRSWFLTAPKITATDASIEIKNNTAYGSAQEFGFNSARAKRFIPGKFMLKRGMDELNTQAPQILEAEIQRFINKTVGR